MSKVTLFIPEILQELITATSIRTALSCQCEPIESCSIDPVWESHSIQVSPAVRQTAVKAEGPFVNRMKLNHLAH